MEEFIKKYKSPEQYIYIKYVDTEFLLNNHEKPLN